MAKQYALAAKAWQIHDVLQTLFSALPEDGADSAVPVLGVVGLLTTLSRDLADEISEIKDVGEIRCVDSDGHASQEVSNG